jgi:hypothetical protein
LAAVRSSADQPPAAATVTPALRVAVLLNGFGILLFDLLHNIVCWLIARLGGLLLCAYCSMQMMWYGSPWLITGLCAACIALHCFGKVMLGAQRQTLDMTR